MMWHDKNGRLFLHQTRGRITIRHLLPLPDLLLDLVISVKKMQISITHPIIFIGSSRSPFPFRIEELGGVRLISDAEKDNADPMFI